MERSQCRIACGLTVDHTDLSLGGMAVHCQVQRQPRGYLAVEAMVPSPRVESLLEDRTDSSTTIIAGQRENNTEDIDANP